MKKFFGLCAALLMLCTVIFPAKTFAAEAQVSDAEAMQAFRQALTDESDPVGRIFRQDILFTSPYVQGELELFGTVENDVFKSTGELTFWMENDDATTTERIIPFYMTQSGKDMIIYLKANKDWEKFTAPSLAAEIMDVIATPTQAEIEEIIADTKKVEILRETGNRRIMLVTLDGDRLADSLKTRSEDNPDVSSDPIQAATINYFDTALRKANTWYIWTVDKRDWRNIALQFNFSEIVKELARAALNDPNRNWPDEISQILETIAYYSELRSYVTYPSDPAAEKKFEIPKKVLKAKAIDSLTSSVK